MSKEAVAAGLGFKAALASNPLGWAVLGVGLATNLMGSASKKKAAGEKIGYIDNQLSGLTEASQQLGQNVEMRTDIAQDVYGEDISKASYGVGQNLYDLTTQGDYAVGKTGLATSTMTNKIERGRESMRTQFGFQRQGLQNVLGQKLMDIEEYRGSEESRLQSERERLNFERKAAKREANKGFFSSLLGA